MEPETSIAHPREVFAFGDSGFGRSIVLVHNHPGGDPEPSEEDLDYEAPRPSGRAARYLGTDHVIIASTAVSPAPAAT